MKPIAIFRAYPETKGSLFVRVLVFDTQRAMQRTLWLPQSCKGACLANDWRSRYRRGCDRRLVADVGVPRRLLGTEVLAHELMHAALLWGARVGLKLPEATGGYILGERMNDEERLCYALQEMIEQCRMRATRLGLIEARHGD